jgi:endoglucanase
MTTTDTLLLTLAAGTLTLGCAAGTADSKTPEGGGGEVKPSPFLASAVNASRCGPDGLIDDCEDNNNQVAQLGGRGGYWYTFADTDGTEVEPAPGGTYPMSEGGANGSGYAARFSGIVAEGGASPYGGLGFNFVDPKDAYDASKYGGIAFWAKSGPDVNNKIRIKIPDVNTDPQGKVCEQCFNDFGADIELTQDWTEYMITWDAAKQMPYWGKPTPEKISADKIYGFQIQSNKRGAKFDVWIDDITFIGCGK